MPIVDALSATIVITLDVFVTRLLGLVTGGALLLFIPVEIIELGKVGRIVDFVETYFVDDLSKKTVVLEISEGTAECFPVICCAVVDSLACSLIVPVFKTFGVAV